MTTTAALHKEHNDSCVDPKWLIIKIVSWKGCRNRSNLAIDWIGHVSQQHLG